MYVTLNSTSCFRLATFQVVLNHLYLPATILDSLALERSSVLHVLVINDMERPNSAETSRDEWLNNQNTSKIKHRARVI